MSDTATMETLLAQVAKRIDSETGATLFTEVSL